MTTQSKVHKFFSILFIAWFLVSRLYLESDYGQRTDRENDLDTDLERAEKERERRINSRLVQLKELNHLLHDCYTGAPASKCGGNVPVSFFGFKNMDSNFSKKNFNQSEQTERISCSHWLKDQHSP